MRDARKTAAHNKPQGAAGDTRADLRRRRHAAIRGILEQSGISNQDALRRQLSEKGFDVTQATLSRDVHDLNLSKGPSGYASFSLHSAAELRPNFGEMLKNFGARVRQALNLLVVSTTSGSAQPVAAALDRQSWPDVIGTIAGDDTVLIICPDERQARVVRGRIEALLG